MGKKPGAITLTNEERSYLEMQMRSRTIQAQTVQRARILLLRADSLPINSIADKVGINRCSVMLCLKKFNEGGIENALFDAPGRGRNAEITDDEKAWIMQEIGLNHFAPTRVFKKNHQCIYSKTSAAKIVICKFMHSSWCN